jgi:hypothetical protein
MDAAELYRCLTQYAASGSNTENGKNTRTETKQRLSSLIVDVIRDV